MHVAQHSSEIPFDIFNLFQPRAAENKLHKGILYEVLGGFSLVIRQAHSPPKQTLVTLGEQLLPLRVWLCCHSALIQHFVFWAFWISSVGCCLEPNLRQVEPGPTFQTNLHFPC